MADLTIDHEILIEAPTDVVWRTITEPDQITLWFADRVSLDLRPGGEGRFDFDEKAGGKPGTAPLVVEAVDPPHRLAFRWAFPEGEAATAGNSVLVEFTLSEAGPERTRLRVTETGLGDLPLPDDGKADYADDHNHGWTVALGRLVDHLNPPPG
jgi:uncharacterized protein YndB with AHSA1/START domain